MPGDRDRLSYDKNQLYRSVVSQQGRVTVPADFNETQEIFGEELREEALDFVGPRGTPDDGYAITFPSPSPKFDFFINPGTMYVGGVRAFLAAQISYFTQPDWIDAPAPAAAPVNEYIFLRLEEREIGAVEDSTLRDVALGGVDTTQRTRLLQRIVRTNTTAATCADALNEQITAWVKEGYQFDGATMRLTSVATLKVGFETAIAPPDPCEPAASGGYLGAENQLIRVRISAPSKFVWGFDNASFLFRVEVMPDNQTLKLQTAPVDTFHFPRVGQTVEVLRAEAKLANGEFVAFGEGQVVTLTEAYNPDSQTIRLPAVLSPEFLVPDGTARLFLRVWEQELSFAAGTPVTLGNTGIQVTLQAPAGVHTGDFWAFAARPSTPVALYPNRYTQSPQLPDGPRLWVCPLALISWTEGTGSLDVDCRETFDNLVELTKRKAGGCCTVTIKPSDLTNTSLQTIIENLPNQVPVKVCLAVGEYTLDKPVLIKRNDLIIEACPAGAVLRAAGLQDVFGFGLIVLHEANRIELRGLELVLPEAPLAPGLLIGLKANEVDALDGPLMKQISICIGVRIVDCEDVTVEDCRFSFPMRGEFPSVFGAGIFGSGSSVGLTVRNNVFERRGEKATETSIIITKDDFNIWVGYLHMHSATATIVPDQQGNPLKGEMNGALLDRLEIRSSRFTALSAAMLVQGELGTVRVEDNAVEQSYSGFWILTPHTLGFTERVFTVDHKELLTDLPAGLFLADPIVQIASSMGRALEWPGKFSNPKPFDGVVFPAQSPFPPSPPTDLMQRFFRIFTYLALMEQQAFHGPNQFAPNIHVSGNQVALVAIKLPGDEPSNSGPGLVIWCDDVDRADDPQPKHASALVEANRIGVDHQRVAGGIVQLATFCTVNGNIVVNEAPGDNKDSLLVFCSALGIDNLQFSPVAITGNVCRGRLRTEPRPLLPAPFNNWDLLNTVILL